MRPDLGRSRSKPRPSVVLPEPLSPISAMLSPACRSKLASLTARTTPPEVWYSIDRSRTESTASENTASGASQTRIEDVLERARHGHDRQLQDADRQHGSQDIQQTLLEEDGAAYPGQVEHDPPIVARQRGEPEQVQADLGIDRAGHADGETHQDEVRHIRQDLEEE